MDVKIGWIIAFLLITLVCNIFIYGVVEDDIAKAATASQAITQNVTISNVISVTGAGSVFNTIGRALLWDYPTVFNGNWIWVKYVLLCVSLPAMIGLALILFRLLSPVLMSLPSFLRR